MAAPFTKRVLQLCLTLSLLQSTVLAAHMHRHEQYHRREAMVKRQNANVDVNALVAGIQQIETAMGNPSLSSSFISWIQGAASRLKSIDLVVVLGPSQSSVLASTPSASSSTSSSAQAMTSVASTSPSSAGPSVTSASATYSLSTTITASQTSKASPTPTSTSTPGTTYNPANSNVVVYYGQTPGTKSDGSDLQKICQDPNVDVVIMAFIYEYFSTNGWPAVDLGPACWAAKNSIAPSVYDCSPYAPMIQTCQSSGKKVMVSIGGAVGQSSFNSHDQAVTFANNLWNMFGSPIYTNKTFTAADGSAQNWTDFRPFGPSITFDGVDIDNENNNPAYYADFVTALRSNYALDTSGRQYYVSSAPQCPYPDASNPQAMLAQCDFVNVQFYNNPWCNIGSNGFLDSVETWSNFLGNSTYMGANGKGPQLLIGIPALNNVGSGYIAAAQLGQYIDGVKGLELPNFGGIMMWDGTEALNNVDAQGNNFLDAAAATLN